MSRERGQKADIYIAKHFATEDSDLTRVREALMSDGKFGINVGPAEGRILQFLCKITNAQRVIEIGTLYGYSTLWMAKAIPEGGKIISIEFNSEHYKKAKVLIEQSDVAQKIEIKNGDAKEILKDINFEADLVFIDADKPGYPDYLNWALKHVRVGGLIVGDNTFLFGHMIDEDRGEKTSEKAKAAMKSFNETLAQHPDYFSLMIPTYEGMTVGLRIR